MKVLTEFPYDREAALRYANYWAYRRNPAFYDFENIGGDCTNYASQCLLAGTGVMNFTPTFGWYYLDLDHRAPAWTGVVYLYNFLTTNKGVGPFGREVGIQEIVPGDLCQLRFTKDVFQHTPVIVKVGSPITPATVQVAAHSYDADCRPLNTYAYAEVRFIHIEGYRDMVEVPE